MHNPKLEPLCSRGLLLSSWALSAAQLDRAALLSCDGGCGKASCAALLCLFCLVWSPNMNRLCLVARAAVILHSTRYHFFMPSLPANLHQLLDRTNVSLGGDVHISVASVPAASARVFDAAVPYLFLLERPRGVPSSPLSACEGRLRRPRLLLLLPRRTTSGSRHWLVLLPFPRAKTEPCLCTSRTLSSWISDL